MSAFIDRFLATDVFTQLFTAALLLKIGQQAVQSHQRLKRLGFQVACAAFVGAVAWSVAIWNMDLAEELWVILTGAIVVAVLTLGLAWTLLPIVACVADVCVRQPIRYCGDVLGRGWNCWRTFQKRRRDLQDQQLAEAEYERQRPEREQRAAEQDAERTRQQTEQQRLDQLRFDVRLFYDRYRAELQSTFPQDVFNSYFSSFLTEDTPLELFEQRAEQLKEMIRSRVQINPRRGTPSFDSLEELLQYFADRKTGIRQLQTDDPDLVDTLVSTLDEAQDKAIREFLS